MTLTLSRRRLVLALACAALGCGCCGAGSGARTRTTTSEQGVDAVVRHLEHHFMLSPDGTRAHRVHQVTHVVTDYAIDELGDPRLVHNAVGQRLSVLKAETRMRDGTVVAAKPNSVNETTPDVLATAPAYSDLRETVVSHVGMETGCVNELEYEVVGPTSPAPLWAEVPLNLAFPVERLVVRVTVPPTGRLVWACVGCQVRPVSASTPEGAETTFSWSRLPAYGLHESAPGSRPPIAGQPRLVLSTAPSWKALSDDLAARFAAASTPTAAVRAKADELLAGLATTEDRLARLQRFVASDLATVDWPLDQLGFSPAPAGIVLERSYGHTLDKAALLAALLQAAGIPARGALVSRDHLLAAEVPALAQLTEAWVIADAGGTRWLSPAAVHRGDGRAHLEGRWVLRLGAERPTPLDLGEAGGEANRSLVKAELALTAEGRVEGTLRVTATGTYDPFVDVEADKGGHALAVGLAGGLQAGDWDTACDGCFADAVRLGPEASVFVLKGGIKAGDGDRVREVPLPWPPYSQLAGLALHHKNRSTIIQLRSRGVEESEVELTLPDGWDVASPLPAASLESPVGSVTVRSERKGPKLTITRKLRLAKRIIEPADYPHLRALAAALLRADARSVLVRRKAVEVAAE